MKSEEIESKQKIVVKKHKLSSVNQFTSNKNKKGSTNIRERRKTLKSNQNILFYVNFKENSIVIKKKEDLPIKKKEEVSHPKLFKQIKKLLIKCRNEGSLYIRIYLMNVINDLYSVIKDPWIFGSFCIFFE